MDSAVALNYSSQAIEAFEASAPKLMNSGFRHTAAVHRQLAALMREAVKFILPDHGDLVALESLDESFSDFVRLPYDAVCLEYPFSPEEDVYTGDPQFAEHPASRRIAVCWSTAVAGRYPALVPPGGPAGGYFTASVYQSDGDKRWMLCPVVSFTPLSPAIYQGVLPPTSAAETLEREFLLKRGAIKLSNSSYETYTVRLCPEMVMLMAHELGSEDAAMARLSLDVRDETSTSYGFCLTVNASNVGRTRIAPPEKLNKKRLANGKPPFYEAWVLDIAPSKGTLAAREGALEPGQRLPPRMHLRRGHIRRLAPDRITFVRATTVGSPQQGLVDKQYRVQAGNEQ
ncbi:hypothetical protein D3C71_21460 [compost metagenome]